MQYLTIHPILGLKDSVTIDSPALFQALGENVFATHDTGGQNMDYIRERNSANKSYGYTQWSNSATSTNTLVTGILEVWDGTNRDHLVADAGTMFAYDGSDDPVSKQTGLSATNLFSIIEFGAYAIYTDKGNLTPYKWKNGDASATKLILSGTEYKFRYLQHLGNRIIGAYSDQTNGDLDFRWTDTLPTYATLDFDVANQLYKVEGDSITGIGKLCHENLYLFSATDIVRMDHNENSTPVFSQVRVATGWGAKDHFSIISDGEFLYFYDDKHGFVKYDGGRGLKVISEDIEDMIGGISIAYSHLIVGKWLPPTGQIAWSVPLSGSATNNAILFYNIRTGQWTRNVVTASYIDYWTTTGVLMEGDTDGHLYSHTGETLKTAAWDGYRIEPILPLGQTENYARILEIRVQSANAVNKELHFWHRGGDTISEVESLGWVVLYGAHDGASNQTTKLIDTSENFGTLGVSTGARVKNETDGCWGVVTSISTTTNTNDTLNCSAGFTGGTENDFDSGDTYTVTNPGITDLGSINLNNPGNPTIYPDVTARLHQIRWGTDGASEFFSVPSIRIGYIPQGKY